MAIPQKHNHAPKSASKSSSVTKKRSPPSSDVNINSKFPKWWRQTVGAIALNVVCNLPFIGLAFVAYIANRSFSIPFALWTVYESGPVTAVIVYLLYSYTKKEDGSRVSPRFRDSWLLDWVNEWFPARCHLEVPVEKGPFIFGLHPHGAFGCNYLLFHGAQTGSHYFPGVECYALAAKAIMRVPFIREAFIGWGFADASHKVIGQLIERGKSVCIYLGSEQESFEFANNGDVVLYLQTRKGFCKAAIRHNVALVPTFTFGQNDIYNQANGFVPAFRRIIMEKFRVLLIVFWGKFLFMPYHVPLDMCVGAPIYPEHQDENPDDATVEALHARYVAAVVGLYEKNKRSFGYADRKLIMR